MDISLYLQFANKC